MIPSLTHLYDQPFGVDGELHGPVSVFPEQTENTRSTPPQTPLALKNLRHELLHRRTMDLVGAILGAVLILMLIVGLYFAFARTHEISPLRGSPLKEIEGASRTTSADAILVR